MAKLQKGDVVLVEGTVSTFNVGGEVCVDFGFTYGGAGPLHWVKPERVQINEHRALRWRRRIAALLTKWANAIKPEEN